MTLRVFIGWDDRENESYRVAERSLNKFGISAIPIWEQRLRLQGLLTRPVDRRGQLWDMNSAASMSTDFAISRFFTPVLAHSGFALFTDCDVVFLENPMSVLQHVDNKHAVWVVKHPPLLGAGIKMDGQPQVPYPRKNWSSVCLWNCDHPANHRLNLTTLNQWPGRDLHAFGWLADDEIGELPPEYNWLVNVQAKPAHPRIAHFTQGGPWLPGWEPHQHDDLWRAASEL